MIVINPKIRCQLHSRPEIIQPIQPCCKVNHVAVCLTPKQWKRLSTFMLGCLSSWNGQHAMPFRFTRMPYISAACLAVTFSFTASNTFILSLSEIKKHLPSPQRKANASNFHIFFCYRSYPIPALHAFPVRPVCFCFPPCKPVPDRFPCFLLNLFLIHTAYLRLLERRLDFP